jgi:outer membrane protein OmpA-like peptidoglycan-associated protein
VNPPTLVRALLLAALHAGAAMAQTEAVEDPGTQRMIEALKPPADRSLRNLQVGPAPAASAAATAAQAATAAAALPSLALDIRFELNSAHLRPESGALLGSLVAAMLSPALRSNHFLIEGHADARGSAELNRRLSQERAEEVRLYLVALGVQPARLKAVGRGIDVPANAGDPLAPENRRVRVVTVR